MASRVKFKSELKRISIGFIAALVISSFVFNFPWLFLNAITLFKDARPESLTFGVFSTLYTFLILIFWGVPSHLLFLYLKVQSVWPYLLSGLLSGPILIVFFKPLGGGDPALLFLQSVILGIVGLLPASVFWYFTVRKRVFDH